MLLTNYMHRVLGMGLARPHGEGNKCRFLLQMILYTKVKHELMP